MSVNNDVVVSENGTPEEIKLRLGITERIIKEIYELNCLPESLLRKNVFKYYVRFIKQPQGDNNGQETSSEKKDRIKSENSNIVKNLFKKNYH